MKNRVVVFPLKALMGKTFKATKGNHGDTENTEKHRECLMKNRVAAFPLKALMGKTFKAIHGHLRCRGTNK